MQRPASSWSVSARGWLKRFFVPGHIALGRVLADVWPESVQYASVADLALPTTAAMLWQPLWRQAEPKKIADT